MIAQLARDENTSMILESVQSTGPVSTQGSVQGALAGMKGTAKNVQDKDVPATVVINNIQWDQGAITADDPTSGANLTAYVISTKFPGNPNKLVTIIYTALTSEFDAVNTKNFQPMLQSFKFS
jgi:hypothetical protein